MFRKAAASPKDETSATHSPTEITIRRFGAKGPNLRENQLSGTTAANVKKWTQNFNLETQQMSKKIMDIIKAAKCTKEQLQQASTQYALFKCCPQAQHHKSPTGSCCWSSSYSLTSYGCFQTSAESRSGLHHSLRSVFIEIVHSVPAVNKSCAIWALGLLHLICLFHFDHARIIRGLAAKTAEPWY